MFTATRKRKMYGLAQPLDGPGRPPIPMMEDIGEYEEGGQIEGAPTVLAQPEPSTPAIAEPPAKKQKQEEPTETKPKEEQPTKESKEEPKEEPKEDVKEDKVDGLAAVDQRTYNSIKDIPITKLTISRSPVKSNIVTVLNVISLGQLKQITDKLGYDKLWHLALKVTLDNGKSYRIEKNQNISIKPYNEYPGTEIFQLAKSKKAITLRGLMNASLKKEGETRFYEYDAFKNNCQMFVTSLLRSSGLLIPPAAKFISQDSAAIAKGIPGYVAPAAKALTSFAAKADKLVQKLFGVKIFKEGGLITI
jgi:hypothetical protein